MWRLSKHTCRYTSKNQGISLDVLGYIGLLGHRTHGYMGPRIKEYPGCPRIYRTTWT